ncbi:hypothetical protein ACFLYB_05395 [Chloroflexota bacterium]
MKNITIAILVLITLIAGSSLVASCTQGEVTKTATVTNNVTATGPGATTTVTATVTQPPATTTQPPATTTQPPSTLQPTMTAGELAASGEVLFNKACTYPDCHTKWVEGGKDDFTAEILRPFVDAGRVFNRINNTLHQNILDIQEAVLTHDCCLQVLALILVQSDIIQSNDLICLDDLASITIDVESDEH